jgi:16S rRNA (guanine966-N2)-methyltransferase
MRIVAGTHRGRVLKAPKGDDVRPTSEKVRLAVFNMLQSRGIVVDAAVLDAFCGTGALGLEALSQGAAFCTFWDKSPDSLKCCQANIQNLKFEAQSVSALKDACGPKDNPDPDSRFSLVFIDPPYRKGLAEKALRKLMSGQWLLDDAVAVIETGADETVDAPMDIFQEKTYGDTKIILARVRPG